VNLNNLSVTNLTYAVGSNEDGSYDIAIGSKGIGLVTAGYSGSGWVRLYALDTSTDTISIRSDIPGYSTINDDTRAVRSYDRGKIYLVGNNSDGWVAVYDAASDSFVHVHGLGTYLYQSPVALNRDGSMAAFQLYYNFQIVDSDFNTIMGLSDSKVGAAFAPSSNIFYQFDQKEKSLLAIDTVRWELLGNIDTSMITRTYEKFFSGETAVTGDGRVLGVTDPNYVVLCRREHCVTTLPGRTIGGLDFGNKAKLCGDIDGDGDVDFKDVGYLCDDWLRSEVSTDTVPAIRDYFVNMTDFARFANAWLSHKGDANWDALCDVAPAGGDGFINFEDMRALADEWLLAGVRYDSDIAGADGYVNLQDFACLAANWGTAENIIEYDEDFETGDFSYLPWENSTSYPWIVTTYEHFEGSFSAMSADSFSESILGVTVTCGEGRIYFMLKSGKGGIFSFYIDQEQVFEWYGYWDGDLGWSLISMPVSAGTHTFEWSFEHDGTGEPHAWIDAIRFPPANN
jgi:hypothetical protein